jgi:hypothetical protein
MPIDATCPGCQKRYKLKDELAGKSVKCSNPDCRKPFPVPGGTANGKPAVAKPKAKTKKELEAEAEALAEALFNEAGEAKPAAERQIGVECVMCTHKWTEPESKAGKNVICPECKHRMKVPDPKAKKQADWRDSSGGRRAGERGPDLPDDLAAQQMKDADIDSLVKAGAIEKPEVEPRPLSFWITLATVILVVVGGTAGAFYWVVKSGQTGQENAAMAEAMKGLEELKADDSPVQKDDRRLMRAALHIAGGEYHARLNTKEGVKAALKEFAAARRELEQAPSKQYERDALFAELAVAQLALGGTDEQVAAEVRLGWTPQGARGKGPAVGTTVVDHVQTELRQTLAKFHEREVDRGVRLMTIARLARELSKKGHPEVLFEIVPQAFPEDALEVQAFALLVVLRNGGTEDQVKPQAIALRDLLKGDPKTAPPPPWPVVALFDRLGMTDYDAKAAIPPPVADGSPVSRETRFAYAALYACQDNTERAVKVACSPPGTAAERFPAMAMLAELMPDPKPLLEEAAKATDAQTSNRFHLYRLARAAADAGAVDKADQFAKKIDHEGLREWATGEALRAKWAASKSAPAAADLTLPADPAKARAGHGWAAIQFARHHARATGEGGTSKTYDEWADKKLRGFGYAGMALGLQDGK